MEMQTALVGAILEPLVTVGKGPKGLKGHKRQQGQEFPVLYVL